jgi:hypothetical protein
MEKINTKKEKMKFIICDHENSIPWILARIIDPTFL